MNFKLITGAFLLSASLLCAQEKTQSQQKVRIKKVEVVNGVEKTTDTTYYIDGPIKITDMETLNPDASASSKGEKKMVIITDEVHGDNLSPADKVEMDERVQKALKEAGIDPKNVSDKDLFVVNTEVKKNGEAGTKTKVVIIRSAKISTATSEDCKSLGKLSELTGLVDNKLNIESMNFYPNPNDGKFTLEFNLKGKGDTEVNVMNMEGKPVYSEMLKNFSGNYKKEIDISANPKGTYFVKVKQGEHSQLKKIVLE